MYLKNISFSCFFFFFFFTAHQGVSHPKIPADGRASARCLSAPSCHTADGGGVYGEGGAEEERRGERRKETGDGSGRSATR